MTWLWIALLIWFALMGWALAIYFGRKLAQRYDELREAQFEATLYKTAGMSVAQDLAQERRQKPMHFNMRGVEQSFRPYDQYWVEGRQQIRGRN